MIMSQINKEKILHLDKMKKMSSSATIVNVICRACLNPDQNILISANNMFLRNYNLLTNLHVTSSDDKPQFFCYTCFKIVEQFAQFRDKCIQSEKTLEGLTIKVEDEQLDAYKYSDDEIIFDNDTEEVKTAIKQNSTLMKNSLDTKKVNNEAEKHTSANKVHQILTDTDVLNCGICTETFTLDDNEKLIMHIDSHKNDNQCQICKEHFTEWPAVLAHRVKHLCNKRHQKCHICDKHFASDIGMEYHYRNEHFKEKQSTDLTCKWCSKVFNAPRKLRRHIKWMHVPSKHLFKCDVCSKMCKSRQKLTVHLKVHSDKKENVCDDCGYSCKAIGRLSDHIRRVHLKMVFCTSCNKAFKNRQILAEHKSMCTVTRGLCPVCGKRVIKQRLKKHMEVHSDDGKYKCTICPAVYKSKMALNDHLDRHEGRKRRQCDVCSLKFYTYSSLIKHKRVHTGEKPYKCKICDKCFTGGHNLKVHMKVHGEYLVKKKALETTIHLRS